MRSIRDSLKLCKYLPEENNFANIVSFIPKRVNLSFKLFWFAIYKKLENSIPQKNRLQFLFVTNLNRELCPIQLKRVNWSFKTSIFGDFKTQPQVKQRLIDCIVFFLMFRKFLQSFLLSNKKRKLMDISETEVTIFCELWFDE